MTKTFKIGEYASGGTIKVYIYYSFDKNRIERDLFEITSSYWSDEILYYIATIMQIDSKKANAPMIGSRCRI